MEQEQAAIRQAHVQQWIAVLRHAKSIRADPDKMSAIRDYMRSEVIELRALLDEAN